MTTNTTGPQMTPEAEAAVKAFKKIEAEFNEFEDFMSTGKFMADIITNCGGDVAKAQREFQTLWNRGRQLVEQYNAALRSAKDAMRQLVQLAPTQERGINGKTTTVSSNGFNATSVTKRSWDSGDLFRKIGEHGLTERMLELSTTDKDGKSIRVVQQTWDIQFDPLLNWLRSNGLEDVIQVAYNEKEATPQCRGPKELYFFGDKKKD